MRPDDDLQKVDIVEPGSEEFASSSSNASVSSGSKKIVVADTSPLNYLIQIECAVLLPLLYQRIIAPPMVLTELTDVGTPPVVAEWAAHSPVWLEILALQSQPDAQLYLLDAGERDAIQLAIELQASEILIDEFKGRREARSRGFAVVGTLGVLIAGEQAHLVDARSAFERLITQTNFHITPQLRQTFLELIRPSIRT